MESLAARAFLVTMLKFGGQSMRMTLYSSSSRSWIARRSWLCTLKYARFAKLSCELQVNVYQPEV